MIISPQCCHKSDSLLPSDIGRPITNFSNSAIIQHIVTDTKEVIESLRDIEREVWTEEKKYFLIRVRPYRTGMNVQGTVATFVEITNFKSLKAEKEAAEASNAIQRDFLANMSHEIRTP